MIKYCSYFIESRSLESQTREILSFSTLNSLHFYLKKIGCREGAKQPWNISYKLQITNSPIRKSDYGDPSFSASNYTLHIFVSSIAAMEYWLSLLINKCVAFLYRRAAPWARATNNVKKPQSQMCESCRKLDLRFL